MNQVPKSFEAACAITGDNQNVEFPDFLSKATIAGHKLEIIHKATNTIDGKLWEPDFSDYSQAKYTGWIEKLAHRSAVPSRSAFVYTYTCCSDSYTLLGARFWFPDRATARKFTEQHIDLINELHA